MRVDIANSIQRSDIVSLTLSVVSVVSVMSEGSVADGRARSPVLVKTLCLVSQFVQFLLHYVRDLLA